MALCCDTRKMRSDQATAPAKAKAAKAPAPRRKVRTDAEVLRVVEERAEAIRSGKVKPISREAILADYGMKA